MKITPVMRGTFRLWLAASILWLSYGYIAPPNPQRMEGYAEIDNKAFAKDTLGVEYAKQGRPECKGVLDSLVPVTPGPHYMANDDYCAHLSETIRYSDELKSKIAAGKELSQADIDLDYLHVREREATKLRTERFVEHLENMLILFPVFFVVAWLAQWVLAGFKRKTE